MAKVLLAVAATAAVGVAAFVLTLPRKGKKEGEIIDGGESVSGEKEWEVGSPRETQSGVLAEEDEVPEEAPDLSGSSRDSGFGLELTGDKATVNVYESVSQVSSNEPVSNEPVKAEGSMVKLSEEEKVLLPAVSVVGLEKPNVSASEINAASPPDIGAVEGPKTVKGDVQGSPVQGGVGDKEVATPSNPPEALVDQTTDLASSPPLQLARVESITMTPPDSPPSKVATAGRGVRSGGPVKGMGMAALVDMKVPSTWRSASMEKIEKGGESSPESKPPSVSAVGPMEKSQVTPEKGGESTPETKPPSVTAVGPSVESQVTPEAPRLSAASADGKTPPKERPSVDLASEAPKPTEEVAESALKIKPPSLSPAPMKKRTPEAPSSITASVEGKTAPVESPSVDEGSKGPGPELVESSRAAQKELPSAAEIESVSKRVDVPENAEASKSAAIETKAPPLVVSTPEALSVKTLTPIETPEKPAASITPQGESTPILAAGSTPFLKPSYASLAKSPPKASPLPAKSLSPPPALGRKSLSSIPAPPQGLSKPSSPPPANERKSASLGSYAEMAQPASARPPPSPATSPTDRSRFGFVAKLPKLATSPPSSQNGSVAVSPTPVNAQKAPVETQVGFEVPKPLSPSAPAFTPAKREATPKVGEGVSEKLKEGAKGSASTEEVMEEALANANGDVASEAKSPIPAASLSITIPGSEANAQTDEQPTLEDESQSNATTPATTPATSPSQRSFVEGVVWNADKTAKNKAKRDKKKAKKSRSRATSPTREDA